MEGDGKLAERRDSANREYQLARAAFERGDFVTAEPLFRKAVEFAPEFPEPHFALAQLMQRLGRTEEAQHFMAQVNQRIPQNAAGSELAQAQAVAAQQKPLLEHALETARTLRVIRPEAPFVGRALLAAARAMDESRQLVAQMARSSKQQDVHNSRIHAAHHLEAELKLREVLANPLEANGWWQLALQSFNSRREFETASHALEAAMRLSASPTSRASYFLLYHAWQHLCDWRDWPLRLRQLRDSARAALDTSGPAEARTGGARAVTGAGAGASSAFAPPDVVRALQPPYVLLVSRLIDLEPQLVLRTLISNALAVSAPDAARARALALPPDAYMRGGKLAVGYLSGVPAGHVTYDLVRHTPDPQP